jgi:hypothetical protein
MNLVVVVAAAVVVVVPPLRMNGLLRSSQNLNSLPYLKNERPT